MGVKFLLSDAFQNRERREILEKSFNPVEYDGIRNLRRMVQFAEVFPEFKIVSPLVSQLSWTHFIILMTLPTDEARLFYARLAIESKWSKRELQRQIERKAFERAEIVENGWRRHVLALAIKSDLFARQGKAISNFKATLLAPL